MFLPTALEMLVLILIIFPLYLLPTLLAIARHKRQAAAIVTLNVVAGWTLIGWVAALAWALTTDRA